VCGCGIVSKCGSTARFFVELFLYLYFARTENFFENREEFEVFIGLLSPTIGKKGVKVNECFVCVAAQDSEPVCGRRRYS